MTDDTFWQLIEKSKRNSPAEQAQSLAQLLPRSQVAAFDKAALRHFRSAYDWGLWGAASVALGGASDDTFMDFRWWLIGQGRERFEGALADPDGLADWLPDGELDIRDSPLDHGLDPLEPVTFEFSGTIPEPTGTRVPADPVLEAARYPKLWARYRGAPPQGPAVSQLPVDEMAAALISKQAELFSSPRCPKERIIGALNDSLTEILGRLPPNVPPYDRLSMLIRSYAQRAANELSDPMPELPDEPKEAIRVLWQWLLSYGLEPNIDIVAFRCKVHPDEVRRVVAEWE